mmetsp:Transcript_14695/g.47185  ORF Transcript_14695/g.47185 Transcript_14695/m.47185 type:complete len:341 (+) Transcript_14695:1789-2811(+)
MVVHRRGLAAHANHDSDGQDGPGKPEPPPAAVHAPRADGHARHPARAAADRVWRRRPAKGPHGDRVRGLPCAAIRHPLGRRQGLRDCAAAAGPRPHPPLHARHRPGRARTLAHVRARRVARCLWQAARQARHRHRRHREVPRRHRRHAAPRARGGAADGHARQHGPRDASPPLDRQGARAQDGAADRRPSDAGARRGGHLLRHSARLDLRLGAPAALRRRAGRGALAQGGTARAAVTTRLAAARARPLHARAQRGRALLPVHERPDQRREPRGDRALRGPHVGVSEGRGEARGCSSRSPADAKNKGPNYGMLYLRLKVLFCEVRVGFEGVSHPHGFTASR